MNRSARSKVVILDRDGTIVIDRGYLSDPEGLEFLPGAASGLQSMQLQGYRLLVITNQSGIGRGMFPLERLLQMNNRLRDMTLSAGAQIEAIYYCPHAPEDRCDCRKPRQKLMLLAAAELGFDPTDAIVIGDKNSDIEFGQRAGATTMLIAQAPDAASASTADYVVRDLEQAAKLLQTLG